MKIRTRNATGEKIEMQMSSMIDVVFQLLIFFMLTLKIVAPEGDFDINMPLGAPPSESSVDPNLPAIKVRMEADANGRLTGLFFNETQLFDGDETVAFERLNQQVLNSLNSLDAIDAESREKQEVELNPAYNLDYRYIVSAIGKCKGRIVDGETVALINRIKFAPKRKQPGQ